MQPQFSCFCSHIQSFDPKIDFIILIHPIEVRRRIATGRMAHLCLEHSQLISGADFSEDPKIGKIINDPGRNCMLLYPGKDSMNLSEENRENQKGLVKPNKRLTLFVIDGTWATAKKTVWKSPNLRSLPSICFTPSYKSNFRVRKQPSSQFLSTIEAIHYTIGILGPKVGFDTDSREHDLLLKAFDFMVERQVELINHAKTQFEAKHPFRKWPRV